MTMNKINKNYFSNWRTSDYAVTSTSTDIVVVSGITAASGSLMLVTAALDLSFTNPNAFPGTQDLVVGEVYVDSNFYLNGQMIYMQSIF